MHFYPLKRITKKWRDTINRSVSHSTVLFIESGSTTSFFVSMGSYNASAWQQPDAKSYDTTMRAVNRPLQLVHFVFPFQTTWCPHGNFPFVCFISYAYICACWGDIWKKLFPRVASRGLKWENKTYKLKRSIESLCFFVFDSSLQYFPMTGQLLFLVKSVLGLWLESHWL